MKSCTEKQLTELGIPFYEDLGPELLKMIEENKYHNKDPSSFTEFDFYRSEYERYSCYTDMYNQIKHRTGPMDLNDIIFYTLL